MSLRTSSRSLRRPGGRASWRVRAVVAVSALAVVAAACSSDSSGSDSEDSPPADPPVIESVSVAENPNSTLSAVLEVATDVPADASVVVTGPEREFTITAPDAPGTDLTIPVVGMRPETTYEVSVTAEAEGGSDPSEAVEESFTTGALPEGFPPIEVQVREPERMQPGFTLFDAHGTPPEGQTTGGMSYAIAVDDEGVPIWYYADPAGVGDIRQLDNGDLLMGIAFDRARLIDVLGNTIINWAGNVAVADAAEGREDPLPPGTLEPATDSLHHEVGLLPNGNLLTISTQIYDTAPFDEPICGDETSFDGVYHLVDDLIVEIDINTGDVVREIAMTDLLNPEDDPQRWICGGAPGGVGPALYEEDFEMRTWTHANGVILDEDRNALIVSLREPDLILAIRNEDDENGPAGELLWSFGEEGDVTLTEGDFMYHQHAPQLQEDGTIVFFDNGNDRPGFELTPYSRAVRYEIDDSDLDDVTATQVWEYVPMRNGTTSYSFFVGDADVLENGNVLISSGGDADRPMFEVVPDDSPEGGEVVWQATVFERDGVYRAERIATLTPWDS